jgi:hypothetical protein
MIYSIISSKILSYDAHVSISPNYSTTDKFSDLSETLGELIFLRLQMKIADGLTWTIRAPGAENVNKDPMAKLIVSLRKRHDRAFGGLLLSVPS